MCLSALKMCIVCILGVFDSLCFFENVTLLLGEGSNVFASSLSDGGQTYFASNLEGGEFFQVAEQKFNPPLYFNFDHFLR